MDSLKFPHLGGRHGEGRTRRVMARDKVGHNGLGPLFSVTEKIEILPPCEIEKAYKHSIHHLFGVNTKVLGVKGLGP